MSGVSRKWVLVFVTRQCVVGLFQDVVDHFQHVIGFFQQIVGLFQYVFGFFQRVVGFDLPNKWAHRHACPGTNKICRHI